MTAFHVLIERSPSFIGFPANKHHQCVYKMNNVSMENA